MIVCLCFLIQVNGHLEYRSKIPNGFQVPDPCDIVSNSAWQGVGQKSTSGAGTRNLFGEAFEEAHKKWTIDLCQADSDSDGKSNGEELGNPDCLWIEDSIPNVTVGLSHPGVCEPVNSPMCCGNQTWLSCASFACGRPTVSTTTSVAVTEM